MKKIIIAILLLFASNNIVYSQYFSTTQKEPNVSTTWIGHSVQQRDSTYFISGQTFIAYPSDSINSWASITNTTYSIDGNILDYKYYGNVGSGIFTGLFGSTIMYSQSSNYLIGSTYSTSKFSGFLVKYDTNFDTIFTKTYTTSSDRIFRNAFVLSENNIIVVGEVFDTTSGSLDIEVLKLDSIGNIIWEQTYGGLGEDGAGAVFEHSSGDIIITGYTSSFGLGTYILRIDVAGNLIWQKRINNNPNWAHAHEAPDGSIMVTGCYEYSDFYELDAYIAKLSYASGALLWEKKIDVDYGEWICYTFPVSDSAYIGIGTIFASMAAPEHGFIAKFDYNGDTLWTRRIIANPLHSQNLWHAIEDDDGNIVATGQAFDTLNRQCIWLVKLDCEGRTIGCTLSPIAETATQDEVTIYPNPASDIIQISTTQAFTQLQLFDAQSKKISTQHFASAYHNNIDVTHLARGIYFVLLTHANGEQKVCKFVKE
jgi:hypothetical protein